MRDHSGIQIERNGFNIAGLRQSEPQDGFQDGERLNSLQRIKVVAFSLVGEVQARPNYGDAPDTTRGGAFALHHAQCVLDRKIGEQRGIHGKAPAFE